MRVFTTTIFPPPLFTHKYKDYARSEGRCWKETEEGNNPKVLGEIMLIIPGNGWYIMNFRSGTEMGGGKEVVGEET